MTARTANTFRRALAVALCAVTISGMSRAPLRGDDDKVTAPTVDFIRDVEPILREHCYRCHGTQEQEGELRLDQRASALGADRSEPLIMPGDAAASLLVRRVLGSDDLDVMPPDGEPLADELVTTLRTWIDAGAVWPDDTAASAAESHWAYQPPIRAPLPAVSNPEWPRGAIDRFVFGRLDAEGMAPSPEAERVVLLRRLYLDLIGLPPTVEQVDAFLRDKRPDAFEGEVDRLLDSPQFGERWARPWLDLGRYADSNGFQRDGHREVWPYRDWVVDAINADMPFDRFTIEQLAGDLLPDATLSQRIATGFHRATTVNVEAGVDQEENRVNQVADRVNVTGTVWLGTTIECARCHDHKYDPFTMRDYYGLFAYFNNTQLETRFRTEDATAAIDFRGPWEELPLAADAAAQRAAEQQRHDTLAEKLAAREQERMAGFDEWLASAPAAGESLPEDLVAALNPGNGERNDDDTQRLKEHYLAQDSVIRELREQVQLLDASLETSKPATSLVMVELDAPRETHVMKRGNFLTPGERVAATLPALLHKSDDGLPANRLGLARWLVSSENPLVARVAVNRWWAEIFGDGIVTTLEDFGTQGDRPTHPELLDWLAVELVESGWSRKHVLRLIVTSATYRQSSATSDEALERDPYNRLYARGPRFRLPAETIRDNALAASGLLSLKQGGPPVYPEQPDGVWRVTGQVDNTYRTSSGEDRYRRGLYTVWRRSAPYPSFVAFDAPDRSSCVVQRPRTNTPLQALALLNDPVYTEAALALAHRILADVTDGDVPQRVRYGFRRCLAREPSGAELDALAALYREQHERLGNDRAAVEAILAHSEHAGIGDGIDQHNATELAAWYYVASVLLNLDEMITKS
ncbi:MAG: PSD1 domain-containing protein [Planctomycetales bacterium]|nr:PSD1 domain-containing protein [Planctomycetales bacterium]